MKEEEEDVVKRSKTCLTLQGPDYILEQIEDSSYMFDLKLKRTVHGKNGIDREEFKHEAYGLPLDAALWRIVMYRVAKQNYNQVGEISQFLKDFKKASNVAGKELKQLLKSR